MKPTACHGVVEQVREHTLIVDNGLRGKLEPVEPLLDLRRRDVAEWTLECPGEELRRLFKSLTCRKDSPRAFLNARNSFTASGTWRSGSWLDARGNGRPQAVARGRCRAGPSPRRRWQPQIRGQCRRAEKFDSPTVGRAIGRIEFQATTLPLARLGDPGGLLLGFVAVGEGHEPPQPRSSSRRPARIRGVHRTCDGRGRCGTETLPKVATLGAARRAGNGPSWAPTV